MSLTISAITSLDVLLYSWIRLCIFLSRNFIYTFREISFVRKKNGRIKEWIFTNVWWDFAEQRSLYIISLNKKIKWLEFLFPNVKFIFIGKGLSYLFEKLKIQSKLSWSSYLDLLRNLKISEIINLCKKFQKFVKLPSYKNFFVNVNRKDTSYRWG